MEAVKLLDKKDAPVDWECDGEADTLYISLDAFLDRPEDFARTLARGAGV